MCFPYDVYSTEGNYNMRSETLPSMGLVNYNARIVYYKIYFTVAPLLN